MLLLFFSDVFPISGEFVDSQVRLMDSTYPLRAVLMEFHD